MKTQVTVKNLQDQITHGPVLFDNQSLAQEWVDSVKKTGGFGLVAWDELITAEIPAVYDETGQVEITPAVPAEYIHHPDQFTVEMIEMEDPSIKEARIQKRLKRISFADRLFAELGDQNELDIASGNNTIENVMLADERLAVVQRRMKNSATEVALLMITDMYDLIELYGPTKATFKQKIEAFLAAE